MWTVCKASSIFVVTTVCNSGFILDLKPADDFVNYSQFIDDRCSAVYRKNTFPLTCTHKLQRKQCVDSTLAF